MIRIVNGELHNDLPPLRAGAEDSRGACVLTLTIVDMRHLFSRQP